MFLDPNQLDSVSSADILAEIADGHLGIDHRVLRSLLGRREETLQALLEQVQAGAWRESADLQIDFAQLFHALEAPESIPFLIETIRLQPDDIADEVTEALHFFGEKSLEPLLKLYGELEEEDSEEVAFILATLHIRDERILKILLDRLEFNAAEGAFLLGMYGDPAARKNLEDLAAGLGDEDIALKKEVQEAIQLLETQSAAVHEATPLDIYSRYPEEEELPLDLLPEQERLKLFEHENPALRAAAAYSFFSQQPNDDVAKRLLALAENDSDSEVRSRAWESLLDSTENTQIVESMLKALRRPETPVEERASLLIGLCLEADRNEVRDAIRKLYDEHPEVRAQALEAMWRSFHPSFREYFARHLGDADLEVKRSAVWGVGYYAVKPALDKLRGLFNDEDLRADAIYAYALALPNDISKGRVKGLLTRIEKDAGGLSEMEERLVMAALDERLVLSGKDAFFFPGD